MRDELGPYKFQEPMDDGVHRILKNMEMLPGGKQYYGYWYLNI